MLPALYVSKARNNEYVVSTSSKTFELLSSISNNNSEQTTEIKNKIKKIITKCVIVKGRESFSTLLFNFTQYTPHSSIGVV